MTYLPLILLSVFLNTFAQCCLKQGMLAFQSMSFNAANLMSLYLSSAKNIFIWIGLFSYVLSVGVWMLVLSKVEVSYAYPFLSIGYLLSLVAGYFLFQENITWLRVLGILIICVGVVLVAKSASS